MYVIVIKWHCFSLGPGILSVCLYGVFVYGVGCASTSCVQGDCVSSPPQNLIYGRSVVDEADTYRPWPEGIHVDSNPRTCALLQRLADRVRCL